MKNNYLGRIASPTDRINSDEIERRGAIRDELTPEQMFEQRKNSTTHSAYYNTRGMEDSATLPKGKGGNIKLQDNVKTILGVKD